MAAKAAANSLPAMDLHYQRALLAEMREEDALVVLAPGLGLRFLLANLLRQYCDPEHFVVVLNASADEEEFLISTLALEDVKPLPVVVNNEVSIADRYRGVRQVSERAPGRALTATTRAWSAGRAASMCTRTAASCLSPRASWPSTS